jgi:hypothetical protein
MNPTDEPRRHLRSDSGLVPLLAVDEQDALVRAFHEFIISESNESYGRAEVVAEFSRRLTFLAEALGDDLNYAELPSLLLQLTHAKMAELALESVESKRSHQRLHQYLQSLPFPHYEPVPGNVELVVRVDEDGTRTKGRFIDRAFVAVENGQ